MEYPLFRKIIIMICALMAIAVIGLFFMALNCNAQEPIPVIGPSVTVHLMDSENKSHTWYQPLPVRQRTADHSYIISTTISFISSIVDIELTEQNIHNGATELNPLYGSHPNRARMYGISMPIAGACAYFSWKYKREDDALRDSGITGHKYAKWWIPNLVNTVSHSIGIISNIR